MGGIRISSAKFAYVWAGVDKGNGPILFGFTCLSCGEIKNCTTYESVQHTAHLYSKGPTLIIITLERAMAKFHIQI